MTILLMGSGKGAAAAPVLFHRYTDGAAAGPFGLAMFVIIIAIIAFAWMRFRGGRPNP